MTKPSSASTAKQGPGEYVPDVAFTKPADLPRPKIIKQQRNYVQLPCPHCGTPAARDKVFLRTLHDLGDLVSGRPHELHITYSQHFCRRCAKYFPADLTDLAPRGGHYTHRVMRVAIRVVVEDGLPYRPASWLLWRDHRVFVPFATIQNWVEQAGKKSKRQLGDGISGLGADRLFRLPRRRRTV